MHLDDSCEILLALNLRFHNRHRYIICTCLGGSFQALSDLKSHLKLHHKTDIRDQCTKTMNQDFPAVLDHILKSFSIAIDQESKPFDKEDFDGPIAGIKESVYCFVCPLPSCNSYCTTMDSVRGHYNSYHAKEKRYDSTKVARHWTQFSFAMKGVHSTRVRVNGSMGAQVVLDSHPETNLRSSIRRYAAPQGAEASSLPWLNHVGWTTWRDSQLGNHHTASDLRALVSIPRRISMHRASQPLDGEDLLYFVTVVIRERATQMLRDANQWLGNSELRSAITFG